MKLHDYQRTAVQFLRGKGRGLFLECGLGKSAITLTALEPRHLPVLIVAPKRVAELTWPEECPLWRPDLTVSYATGGPGQRHEALRAGADVTVIGRDVLADAVGLPWSTFVLDELSGFKSKASQRWRHARKIAKGADYVFGLTGTPTSNGLMDLWAQVALLDEGARLGKNLTAYRNRYFYPANRLPNGIVTDWALHDGAEEAIHRAVEDLCLSMRSLDHLDLPPVTINHVPVVLPPKVKSTYKRLKEDLVVGLDGTLDGMRFSAANAAVLSSRLQQLTAGFLYPDTDDDEHTEATVFHAAKLDALEEIVDGTGSPVLCFYWFKAELAALEKRFPQARRLDAAGLHDWNNGKVPILLAHPASAGHGLNLQRGGHTVVWLTQPWSLELWTQANGRLARQGQTQPVVIHVVQATGTVDKAVHASLTGKLETHDALMEHLRSPI